MLDGTGNKGHFKEKPLLKVPLPGSPKLFYRKNIREHFRKPTTSMNFSVHQSMLC